MIRRSGLEKISALLASGAPGIALLIALLIGPGCSEEEPVDPNAGIREIYYLSDLQGQVQPVALYAEQAIDQQEGQFTAEQIEVARSVIRRELSAEKVERAVLQRLADQPQREHLDAAREWLKTPAARKFMQSKAMAWSTAGREEMRIFYEAQQGKPVDERREALIERYDEATDSSGFAAETMLLAAYGVAVMHDVLKPENERNGPAALRESMISQRAILKPIFKETSAVTTRFAFRDQSDDEVEAFVEFVESPPGLWLYSTTSSTFLNGLLEITANLGGAYILALPSQARAE